MARPPLPDGERRGRYVGLRLNGEEEAPVQVVADAEHGGNLSAAIRALLVEALAARTIQALQPTDQSISAEHECDLPPGITESEQRYYVCPVCDAHWVKVKRMVGRQMYRSWHRMSDEQVDRLKAER